MFLQGGNKTYEAFIAFLNGTVERPEADTGFVADGPSGRITRHFRKHRPDLTHFIVLFYFVADRLINRTQYVLGAFG